MLGLVGSATAATALAGCTPGGSASHGGETTASGAAETTKAAVEKTVPSCVLTAEATEGPYFLEGDAVRKDITEGKRGVPVWLRTKVVDATECTPIEDAAVDIWHCDGGGVYSGFGQASNATGGVASSEPPQGPPPEGGEPLEGGGAPPESGNMRAEPTDDQTFLRGVQLTGTDVIAEFETIYPGWYAGRALHIHLKMMIGGNVAGETYDGGHVAHTGQLFFPKDVTDEVAKLEPYRSHDVKLVRHADDGIFQGAGKGSIVKLTPLEEGGSVENGFVAEITLGVDPEATPDPAGMGAEGGPTGGNETTE